MPPAQTLFDVAATRAADQLRPLRGAAVHVNGASGFLASNLIALINRASTLQGLQLKLYASSRRPTETLPLFRFLGIEPSVQWERAPAETTTLQDLAGCIAVHAASYGSPEDYLREPLATFYANTEGLIRTFREASRVGAAHVVNISSAEVYGQPPPTAIPTTVDAAADRCDPSVRPA